MKIVLFAHFGIHMVVLVKAHLVIEDFLVSRHRLRTLQGCL